VDVEENSISAPRLEAGSTRPVIDTISTDDESIGRLIARLEEPRPLGAGDEAGPTGDELFRTLRRAGGSAGLIAPSSIPARPGDRATTDSRDAGRMALSFRASQLSSVRVPTVVGGAA
jgi:transposase